MISLILIIIASILDGFMDMNMNEFQSSIFSDATKYNPLYWNPSVSWQNKWKDPTDESKGPKFFLSTTALVFLTDAWHLFKFLFLTCIFLSVIFYQPLFTLVIFHSHILNLLLTSLSELIIYSILWGISFEITMKSLTK